MNHYFDIDIAKKYGVNSAVLLQNIGHWIKHNEANETNFFDGKYWTYNSRRAFKELFPYMSERQIDTALKKLIDAGIIITGNYNKIAYDRTLWYALTQKGKSILHFDGMEDDKMSNGNNQNVPPIPNINTDENANNKKKERKTTSGYDAILESVEDEELKSLYIEYIKMRKLIKSPMTDRALEMLIAKVNKLEPNSNERQKHMLETAIMNNWKSVYPLKDEEKRTSVGANGIRIRTERTEEDDILDNVF